jgi:four helix bundle protein
VALAHHTLVAWQRADDLFIKLHQLSLKAFPAFEKFELGGQLRRSAFSVPVNIVEGFATEHGKRRLNFLQIAKSSLAEVGYCIHVALRLGYLDENSATELDVEIRKVSAPLQGLIASERLKINAKITGIVLIVFLLGSRLT